ncbi:META domain-containing protein [Novosphingobium huizhouense]|uniref:META domain-containing protein n=1 Tax=Novosphingobium huizhouense TaxID=2866625 RepID=UPI00296FE63D|nr:META domain-containing protein [Novosphingobium huizhouense]
MSKPFRRVTAFAVLILPAVLAACAAQTRPEAATPAPAPVPAPNPAAPADPLAGTRWKLAAIQSMDDAQGTTAPQADRTYEVAFGPDGRAIFRLDCNRANAGYTLVPGSEPGAGGVTFAPAAMTRAMCPPGSLDTRIARDLGYVRSYRIEGDTLSLSLMADGGIYVWKRQP